MVIGVDGPASLVAGCASHSYITHAYGFTLHKCTGFVDGFNPFITIFINSLVLVFSQTDVVRTNKTHRFEYREFIRKFGLTFKNNETEDIF